MNREFFKLQMLMALLLLTCCVANALGQTTKRPLTLEWIFGPEGRAVASVPTTVWLDDGTLVLLDNRRPPAEQTFEKLNPATGQRQSLVDPMRALADLKRVVQVGLELRRFHDTKPDDAISGVQSGYLRCAGC